MRLRRNPSRISGENERRDDQPKNSSEPIPATRLTTATSAGIVISPPLTAAPTATPAWLRNMIRPHSASTIATNCSGLSTASSVGCFCWMHFRPTGSEISRMIGITITKIARHGSTLVTAPPTVGPMAGATVITSEPTPISRPTLERGDCSRMMFIISGVAMPEPMPWITRAARISGNVCATIMISEPSTASTTAATKIVLFLNRRLMNDDSGMVAATASR